MNTPNQPRADSTVAWCFVLVLLGLICLRYRCNTLWHGSGAEPEVMTFDDSDAEMNDAMQKARRSIDDFIAAMQNPRPSQQHFSVKVGFHDEHSGEYIWLNDVRYDDARFDATIANEPNTVRSVWLGMPVSVAKDKIADWMYIDAGVLQGGYTMRVMRDRLSPAERADFDSKIGFRIE